MQPFIPIYADFWKRLLAHNIDLLPVLGLCYGVVLLIPHTYENDYLLFPVVYLTYNIAFEVSAWEGTPGKRWAGIRVSSKGLSSISLTASCIRNVTKALSLLLFFAGFIMIFFDKKNRGLHDHIAGSVVLIAED